MPFVYSQQALDTIGNLLTPDRLNCYLAASKGNKLIAIHLYEYNTIVAECMHGTIQPLEIALRNSIHNILWTDLKDDRWFEKMTFEEPERQAVDAAIATLERWKKPPTPGRIVAELTFGFWVKLMSRKYEKLLWVPHLYKCFRYIKRPDRIAIFKRFDEIRTLRNRVAHHEPLLSRDLQQDYRNIIEALEWICPVTACWIRATSSFHRRIG